jgi:hypothetical protein
MRRRCTFKHTRTMVARKDARTYHCEGRATVRVMDHWMQGRKRNWLCDRHAADANLPVQERVVIKDAGK